jgi:hypothetical protein
MTTAISRTCFGVSFISLGAATILLILVSFT